MPNWCNNTLILNGDDSTLDEISEWFESCVYENSNEDCTIVSFESIEGALPGFWFCSRKESGKLYVWFYTKWSPNFELVKYLAERWTTLSGYFECSEALVGFMIVGEFANGEWIKLIEEDTLYYNAIVVKRICLLTDEVLFEMDNDLQEELLPQIIDREKAVHPLAIEYWKEQDELKKLWKKTRQQ